LTSANAFRPRVITEDGIAIVSMPLFEKASEEILETTVPGEKKTRRRAVHQKKQPFGRISTSGGIRKHSSPLEANARGPSCDNWERCSNIIDFRNLHQENDSWPIAVTE
jgi:hypothetical protein